MTTAQKKENSVTKKNSVHFDDLAIALMDVVLIEIIFIYWF